jgi:phosphopantothenoylcysteine decarboxylase/phosphopantothenate--cysteine ligase
VTDLWAKDYAGEVHVELGGWADALVIAPATMNLLARAATGQANDAVLATLACARGEVSFAPAMHSRMWSHPATQANVRTLHERGAQILGPVTGPLANGEVGEGRMMEPQEIAQALESHFARTDDFAAVRVLITAGPTYEDLDPVRFLGNRSTGRMGYALATEAQRRGAAVALVSGPVHLPAPAGVELIRVRSATEMHAAVMSRFEQFDVVIMAAAVADYRPKDRSAEKIKKRGSIALELVRNPDILADLGAQRSGQPRVLVGFALETKNLERAAREKLRQKAADLIVANEAVHGLGGDTNRVTLVDATSTTPLPEMTKHALANQILDAVRALRNQPPRRARSEVGPGAAN